MNETEYFQQVATELQQGFANSLAQMAANYEGQLAMLKVQHKAELAQAQPEATNVSDVSEAAPAPAAPSE